MFDFVRSHSRLMLGLMVLLIFPSFVFFGIQGYSRFTDGANSTVAKVDGRPITRAEWDQAHQRNVERIRRQMPGVDAKLLDTPERKRETLDAMVDERVLLAAASKLNLAPTDERLQRLFVSDPQFAGLRNPDGSVNRELLAAQGMTSEGFAQQLRQEFAVQQVTAGLRNTGLATPAVAAVSLDALLQQREIQFERFDAQALKGKVAPTDADLETYYKANTSQFNAPEQATIEYVVLDLATLGKGVTIGDEDLQRYYAENAARYTSTEERRASHILVKADKDASAADRQKAKSRAEALLAEVRKNPAGFADVARKSSEDTGSAAQGGDLDFIGRGAMVKPFEDATFAMKPDEISNVIETDFGYHIIKLTAVKGGEKKPFESVRAEIEAEVRKSLAMKKYAEVAEQFTNMVYEQSDSLQPVIDKFKVEKKSATVQRQPAPGATGVLGSARLLQSVFGTDAVRNKRNTDAVEVGPNQLASARVLQHSPSRTLPLADVKDRVKERVIAQQAAALARKDGEARLTMARQNETTLANTAVISRAKTENLPRQALDQILQVDGAKLPQAIGIDLGDAGYLVVRVLKVLPREAAPGGDAQFTAQYAQAWSTVEAKVYLNALKKRLHAEVKEDEVAAAIKAASAAAP